MAPWGEILISRRLRNPKTPEQVVDCLLEKELTDEEFEYYSRQISLAEIGYAGQVRLKNSKVCILGCGGLGVPTMLKLTAMGVGHIRIIDRDVISMSDLHRQYLYDVDSIGRAKVEVAYEKLKKLNPNVEIEPLAEPITKRNVSEVIGGMDVAVDALDSMETRYLVNRACSKQEVPYVFAGVIKSMANASTIIPGKTPCLECFFPGFEDALLPKCALVGVNPAVIGITSSVQVSEAVTILTGKMPKLAGKLLLVDLGDLSFEKIDIQRQENCPVCGSKAQGKPAEVRDKFFEEECSRDGRRTFILNPREKVDIDFDRLLARLSKEGMTVKSKGTLAVSFVVSDTLIANLLKSGTMIAQSLPMKGKKDIDKEVLAFYRLMMIDWLGFSPEIIPVPQH